MFDCVSNKLISPDALALVPNAVPAAWFTDVLVVVEPP